MIRRLAALALTIPIIALGAACGGTDVVSDSTPHADKASAATSYYPKTLAAAGDFNGGSQAGKTAALMASWGPKYVLGLGDYQYEYGSTSAFNSGFQQQMVNNGIPLSLIKPTAGPTHDVASSNGADYISNWGRDPFQPYSFNVGPRWHIINMPSLAYRYGVNVQSDTTWLQNNLAANTRPCVIAYWHEPYFSINSSQHSGTESTFEKPWVQLLYNAHADLLLAGHQHNYARFKPQTPDFTVDSTTGLREFIVGTGGVGFYQWTSSGTNVAVKNDNTFGALKLTLYYNRWTADFVPDPGGTFTDHVGGKCH